MYNNKNKFKIHTQENTPEHENTQSMIDYILKIDKNHILE